VQGPSESKTGRFQFTLRRLFVLVTLFAIVLSVCRWFYITGPVAIRNGYAGLTTSEMTIVFMEQNEGKWPQSWDDLRPCFESACKRQSDYCTFEELQSCMGIDFGFSPQEFVATVREGGEVPELQVIWPRVGSFGWGDWWPNKSISGYLEWSVRNSAFGLTASEIAIAFMEQNEGKWPQGWDDLQPFFESASKRQSKHCTFEEIKSYLEMDFGFSPREFLATLREGGGVPELQVIRPKFGSFDWGDRCPNEMIRAYIEKELVEE